MNNVIKDLHLEKEVSPINEDVDETEDKWVQRNLFFDYCLGDCKKGQLDVIKSVGNIIPTETMDEIIASGGKATRIKFLNTTQSAYETD